MDERLTNPKLLSPLVLAYIGDAVYETYMRKRLLMDHPNMPAYKLHKLNVGLVKAHSQAEGAHAIEGELDENELGVYKRGRNAKSPTMPKHADMMDYRTATGLEALIGYLHLAGRQQRVDELLEKIYLMRYKGNE